VSVKMCIVTSLTFIEHEVKQGLRQGPPKAIQKEK
jgi:hypothetical protein